MKLVVCVTSCQAIPGEQCQVGYLATLDDGRELSGSGAVSIAGTVLNTNNAVEALARQAVSDRFAVTVTAGDTSLWGGRAR